MRTQRERVKARKAGKADSQLSLEVGGALRLRLEAKVNANYKSQNSNNKQITMTEIRNFKRSHPPKKGSPIYVWVIEYWNLRFICNLVLGIWDFGIRISKQAEGRDSYLWERLSSRDITALTTLTNRRIC